MWRARNLRFFWMPSCCLRRRGGVVALMAMSDRLAFPFRSRFPLGCFLVRGSYTFVAVAVVLYV